MAEEPRPGHPEPPAGTQRIRPRPRSHPVSPASLGDLYGPAKSWSRGGSARPEPSALVSLRTERLLLRELRMEDLSSALIYLQDTQVLRYLNWTRPWTREQAREALWEARDLQRHAPRRRYELGIELRETGQLIGECGLALLSPQETSQSSDVATIWFLLRRDQWGRGFATEAALAVLTLAFAELGLPRVFGGCHPENVASRRVLERLGMTFQGAHEDFPGSPDGVRSLVFCIDREQWLAQSGPGFDLSQGNVMDGG